MSKKLYNAIEGYQMVFKYLVKYWEKTKLDDLGGLLGSMDTTIFIDKKPADQSLLSDWETITNNRDLTIEECFDCMIKFIEKQNEWLDLKELIDHLKKSRNSRNQDWNDWFNFNY